MKDKSILSKLAKEKGFISNIIGKSVESKYSTKDFYYLWMCELQKWLRENHKIHILIYVNNDNEGNEPIVWSYAYNSRFDNVLHDDSFNYITDEEFNSYEEALEEGLEQALTLIK
jgi:hypothetical protein